MFINKAQVTRSVAKSTFASASMKVRLDLHQNIKENICYCGRQKPNSTLSRMVLLTYVNHLFDLISLTKISLWLT